MGVRERIAAMLNRSRLEDSLPPLAVDEDNRLFLLEGDGRAAMFPSSQNHRMGYLGALLYGRPVTGMDSTTMERLRGALSNDIPAGTYVQITLLSTPDTDEFVNAYELRRNFQAQAHLTGEQRDLINDMIENRTEMFRKARDVPMIASSGVKSNHSVVMVGIKIPLAGATPTAREIEEVSAKVSMIEESFRTFGMHTHRADAEKYCFFVRRILHMHQRPMNTEVNDLELLRNQILGTGDEVRINDNGQLSTGDTYINVLSIKRLPKTARLSSMNYFIGDPRGIGNQLTEPYMMTLTLHYPDQVKKAIKVRRDAQIINYQAYGPMTRWVPRLAYKKRGFDILTHAMEDGAVLVEMMFTLTLFARDKESLDRLTSATRTYYGSFGLEMGEERHINWPVFFNTLPLFPSAESTRHLHRFRTMTVQHAANFAPILSEWRGSGNGAAMLFESRRGQPVLFDLYDSDTNYNAILFAESGAGKSFMSQQMILDYLSVGAKVWVIDVGHSYLKLCKAVGGEFIDFDPDSSVCLNPFTEVTDIDEDMDVVKMLLAKMAAANGTLDNYGLAVMEEAVKSVWTTHANSACVTDVYDYLLNQDDPQAKIMGKLLYPFTRHGSYGSWFDGEANLNFNSDFVVLELDNLGSRRTLQQVVLLQLIAKIQHEMFVAKSVGDRRPRIVIIDEAWSLLDDSGVAKFLENGYRRFRKYEGAAMVITQSLADLYENTNGRPIVENSANKIIMQQLSESIDDARKTGKLALGEYGFHMLHGVHTVAGKYSEALIYSNNGWGIVRLAVDRYSQVLYSTKGAERSEIIEAIDAGIPVQTAIHEFIARNDCPPRT